MTHRPHTTDSNATRRDVPDGAVSGPRFAGWTVTGWCLFFFSLASVVSGCGEDFDPRSLINKTRILGVRADNPRLDANELATLDALVVAENEDDTYEYFWQFCPFTRGDEENFECELPEELPSEAVALLESREPEFQFFYLQELQGLVDEFCARRAELADQLPEGIPLPDCTSGFPARVRLTVTNTNTGEVSIAVKTLYLAESDPPDTYEDNANPAIENMYLDERGPVRAGVEHDVRCDVDESSLEEFTPIDGAEPKREELQLSWYVRGPDDSVSVDDARTFFSLEDGDPDEAQTNTLTADEPGEVTMWCVIRDGRGGSDWHQLKIDVVE